MANSLLKLVKFKEVANWSPHYLINADIGFLKRFPLVKISMFLKKNKTQTEIKDNESYRRVTIRMNNNGVLLRDTVDGKQIGTKRQFVIKGGQFLVSKIDARNGAFGIAPDSLDGAIVTADFLSFNIDKSLINPLFLELLTSTKQFVDYCQGESSGTTGRQRINESTFLNISVPLPPLNEQSRIVEMFYSKYNKAQKLEEEANRLENSIETYLQKELGIEIVDSYKKNEKMVIIKFMDLDRWGGDSLKNKEKLSFLKNGKYKVTELKNIIKFIQYGLSEKANSSNIGIPMLRMNNINNAELSIDNLKYINLSNQIIEKTKLNKNDLLFNRTNSKELVGKTAVFDKDGVYTFASYLIRIKLDESKCDVHYLNYFLNSRIGRIQIDLTSRQITGQANINSKELQGFIVPLPSLSIQKQIASNVESIRKQVKSLRSEAEKLRVGAKEAFTRELFS